MSKTDDILNGLREPVWKGCENCEQLQTELANACDDITAFQVTLKKRNKKIKQLEAELKTFKEVYP